MMQRRAPLSHRAVHGIEDVVGILCCWRGRRYGWVAGGYHSAPSQQQATGDYQHGEQCSGERRVRSTHIAIALTGRSDRDRRVDGNVFRFYGVVPPAVIGKVNWTSQRIMVMHVDEDHAS